MKTPAGPHDVLVALLKSQFSTNIQLSFLQVSLTYILLSNQNSYFTESRKGCFVGPFAQFLLLFGKKHNIFLSPYLNLTDFFMLRSLLLYLCCSALHFRLLTPQTAFPKIPWPGFLPDFSNGTQAWVGDWKMGGREKYLPVLS